MDYPKISIIMPSLNQGRYIGEAIQSVLDQQYPNLELIVIDGGSADDTVAVIRRYERQIAYWVSEPDGGQSDAINKGMAKATGEIVNWLNSDDYYSPGALQHIAEAFVSGDALCVCGITRVFGGGLDRAKKSYVNKKSLKDTLCNLLIEQPSTFFRKSVFDELGGVPSDLHYVMDRDLWIRFLGQHGVDRIVCIDAPLANFRRHDDSKTVSQQPALFAEYAVLLYQYCHDPELKMLLRSAASDYWQTQNLRDRETTIDAGIIDAMVVFFLLKFARNQSESGNFDLFREICRCVDFSRYGLGSKWKWVRRQSVASEGYFRGMVKYVGKRYFGINIAFS